MKQDYWMNFAGPGPAGGYATRPVDRRGVGTTFRNLLLVTLLLVLNLKLSRAAAAAAETNTGPSFTREIRPILSENCFACHGPDEQKRKAKYRVDTKSGAMTSKDGKALIIPGDPDKSPLFQHLISQDPDELMPPAKSEKKLSPKQIELVKNWIAAGARWDEHWAFIPPERPALPSVKDAAWPKTPIDRFVLSKLESEGIEPNPEADKASLIRRATLDLTGLPPSVEEVDRFLSDNDPQAYEHLVDRLLDSSHYGEHMARYWLDAVRYADTHGYHIDSQRDIWAYRDWVIKAFNKNLPFDQFTIEQLAGDLLPNPTVDQKVATGFVRCNMSTGEGGAIEAEYAAKYAFDRVETLGTVYLGMSVLCSRCHTHKYDPLPIKEYYGMYSFFNNLEEPVMDGNRPNPDPFLKLPSPEQSERLSWLKQHIEDGEHWLEAPVPALDQAQTEWAKKWNERLAGQFASSTPSQTEGTITSQAKIAQQNDGTSRLESVSDSQAAYDALLPLQPGRFAGLKLDVAQDGGNPLPAGTSNKHGFILSEVELDLITGDAGKSETKRLKIARAFADAEAPEGEVGRAFDGNVGTGWMAPSDPTNRPHTAVFVLGEPVSVPDGAKLKVRLKQRSSESRTIISSFKIAVIQSQELVDAFFPPKPQPWKVLGPLPDPETETSFNVTQTAERDLDFGKTYPGVRGEVRWNDATDLADGSENQIVQDLHGVHGIRYFHKQIQSATERQAEIRFSTEAWFKIFVNGVSVVERASEARPGEGPTRVGVKLKGGTNNILIKLISLNGATHFNFSVDRGPNDPLPPDVVGALAASPSPSGGSGAVVRTYYRKENSPTFSRLMQDLADWKSESTRIDNAIPTTLIAREAAQPRETYVLLRGEYDKKGDKVEPSVFTALLPFPSGVPTNRLGLAKWLTHPRHPLTARVTVNRFWQQCFGTGLVKTSEDFGSQGDRPSHPELLDWMATEFIEGGWNVKQTLRTILVSATYRQSSKVTREKRARDPENRLLARGPRYRMDAEMLRDAALATSGLLNEKIGGPSVKPYEPPGLWEAVSFNNSQKYIPDSGPSAFRRSLYTFWKRQSPPPNMLTFDAPTRETCTVRRPRTNTPMQALATLNDPQFVEASRALAERLLSRPLDSENRIRLAMRLATARTPQADEVRILQQILEQQVADYRKDPAKAKELLATGSLRPNPSLDACELAAWTTLAGLILNLDETLNKG
jgi:mono/diheme cytochrome c family protein